MASSSSMPPPRSMVPTKKSKEENIMPNPNWLELPADVTRKILCQVGAVHVLMNAQHVCSRWWNLCKDPGMWRTIDMYDVQSYISAFLCDRKRCFGMGYSGFMCHLEGMCALAIDRSWGQLENIHIRSFGTDALLMNIANSCSKLRTLQLGYCKITDEVFVKVLQKLPLLETLLVERCRLSKDYLVVIGHYCPNLKSLIITEDYGFTSFDEEAFVIASSIPHIINLQLGGNKITFDSLIAILDGCPRIQSLDVHVGAETAVERFADNVQNLRSSQLKRLRLFVGQFPKDGTENLSKLFGEVAKKLPLLEDLFIQILDLEQQKDYLIAVGQSCPLLRSLVFITNQLGCDGLAFAIAKTMPQLVNLQFHGINLTSEGLQAILDGCLHLESLELCRFAPIKISDTLAENYAEQIRRLRLQRALSISS